MTPWDMQMQDGLTNAQWMILHARTQRILADAQADQLERHAQVLMLGLNFLDGQDWLKVHPFPLTPQEFLLEELRAAQRAGFRPPHSHLAKPRKPRRPSKYVPTAAQLRIAIAVLESKEKSHG